MPFVKKAVSLEDKGFGATLREMRRLRGYSISDVSRLSGIHPALLEDLENEKLENVKDPNYAERHVSKLAELLELPPIYLLSLYRSLLKDRGVAASDAALRPCVRRKDFLVTSRLLILGAFLFLVAVVGGYLFWQARTVSSAPRLEITTPTEGEKVSMPRILVRGKTDPKAQVTLNEQPVIVDDGGYFSSYVDVPYGISTLNIMAKKRYSAATVIERHLLFERSAAATSSLDLTGATSTQ
jgi:transcriptional regulator with XRE-family HTH domain